MAAVAKQPRILFSGEGYEAALQTPNHPRYNYPVPPITVGALTQMVVLRKLIAEGAASPSDIQVYEELSAARQKAVEDAGGNGFMAVAATHAALLMAQGAGRLVRASGDRGVVAVLDQRLATARYGSYLKASLPDFWYTTDRNQVRKSLTAIDCGTEPVK